MKDWAEVNLDEDVTVGAKLGVLQALHYWALRREATLWDIVCGDGRREMSGVAGDDSRRKNCSSGEKGELCLKSGREYSDEDKD